MLLMALKRAIEIIGEGASKLSDEFQTAHPEIPWTDIIGMRHRLIHAYFDINLGIVWTTVDARLPALITQLESLLAAKK